MFPTLPLCLSEIRFVTSCKPTPGKCALLADFALQELGSMYDYLAKIILLGPSGSGKFVWLLGSRDGLWAYEFLDHAFFTDS
jgi:hypothetical protein